MANANDIRNDMQVLGSDGGMVGSVDGVEGDRIKLKRGPGGGAHHFVPVSWVARVDDHVHLDRDAALVRDTWTAETGGGAGGIAGTPRGDELPPSRDAYSKSGSSRYVWIAIALVILVGLYGLIRGCAYAA